MNGLQRNSAAWAVRMWFRRTAGSVEDRLAQLLEEINKQVVDVTADLRRGGPEGGLVFALGGVDAIGARGTGDGLH